MFSETVLPIFYLLALWLVLPCCLIALILKGISWYIEHTRDFPLSDDARRSPGHRVRRRFRQKYRLLIILALTLPLLPLLLFSVYLLGGLQSVLSPKALAYALSLLFLLHAYFTVRSLLSAGVLKLALHGEIIVGEQLNGLMRLGYAVYHDVNSNGHCIDHLVLGPQGAFAVVVLSQAKPLRKDNRQFRVRYEKEMLIFPHTKNKKALREAQTQAGNAMTWLVKAGGEAVKVRPLLVIPGWYVELKDPAAFPILTTKQINTFFSRPGKQQLDEFRLEKLQQLIEQQST